MNEAVLTEQGFCVLFTETQINVQVHYNSECIQKNKNLSINGGNLAQCSPHTSKSSTECNIIRWAVVGSFLSTHRRAEETTPFFGDYISKNLFSGSFTRRPKKVRLDLKILGISHCPHCQFQFLTTYHHLCILCKASYSFQNITCSLYRKPQLFYSQLAVLARAHQKFHQSGYPITHYLQPFTFFSSLTWLLCKHYTAGEGLNQTKVHLKQHPACQWPLWKWLFHDSYRVVFLPVHPSSQYFSNTKN